MNNQNESGIIKLLLIFIVLGAMLWYFKIDVRGYIDSHPETKQKIIDFFVYAKAFWVGYFPAVWSFVWNTVLVDTLWKGAVLPIIGLWPKN